MNITQNVGVRGEQNLQVLKDGVVVRETGFQPNLILDEWFTRILTQGNAGSIDAYASARCVVGTGTTAPNPTQTTLVSFLAAASGSIADFSNGSNGIVSNYKEVWSQRVFNFAEGAVVGNIAEVGTTAFAGGLPNASTTLLTRALVLDVNGNPSTISVTAAEQLRVIHRLVTRLSNVPVTGSLSLTTGGVTNTYNYDLRIEDTPGNWGRYGFLDNPGYRNGIAGRAEFVYQNLTQNPDTANASTSGTSVNVGQSASPQSTLISVVKTGLSVAITWEIPASNGNIAGGFQGMRGATLGWAVAFNPRIPKTNLNKFRYTITFNFTRI